MPSLRLGILVDTTLKQQYLADLVEQAGHEIGYSHLLNAECVLPSFSDYDAWVVDLADLGNSVSADKQHLLMMALLEDLIEQADVPVIVNEDAEFKPGSNEHNNWGRRMLLRLSRLKGDVNLQKASPAAEVWVLGASTGGPAAVKDFIKDVPASLNIAFVYAQHIDSGQAETLAKLLSSAGHYPSQVAQQGMVLMNNTLTVITAGSHVSIHENGTLLVSPKSWSGAYAPSINQIAANVARVYRHRCGLIIFSGMGDDGASSCKLIKQQGGQVWVQNPRQCTIASMPEAAIATRVVDFIGSPQDLALALSDLKTAKKVTW